MKRRLWISFNYNDAAGKSIGHTCCVMSGRHFASILDRYMLYPESLNDITVEDKPVSTAQLSKFLKGER